MSLLATGKLEGMGELGGGVTSCSAGGNQKETEFTGAGYEVFKAQAPDCLL